MCGISGFSWNDAALIDSMNAAIKHRGPDDQGIYLDEHVSLGHCRLSIIDLSTAGRQPMTNEDESIWIVFNGEIYNFAEIRKHLEERGHNFKSYTDTEVIIHAYEEWGLSSIERFNGMWAFAIYDKNKKCIFLSRDRFGVKPLYYYQDDRGIIFSSEIKGLLKHNIERMPNDKAIYEYLAFGFTDHSKETFFLGINRLMPGENLVYDLDKRNLRTSKWYNLGSRIKEMKLKEGDPASEGALIKKIRDIFKSSVAYRLIADVPVGSCLSGGIDSSSIVYTMRALSTSQIKTFSMVFPGQRLDESVYIDEVVADTKVEGYKVSPTTEDLMKDLSDLIKTQEEPFRSISIYGQYKVMELAHKNRMKVLLDGQGADELFAGYFIYYKYYIFESLFNLKLNEAKSAAYASKNSLNDLIVFPVATVLSKFRLTEGVLQRIWLHKMKYLNGFFKGKVENPYSERGFNLNKALFSDHTKYSIPQLLRYEDKNSMRWSIESRVPFMDYRLVELVFSLPSNYKIRNGITKYIFRKAIEGSVSDKIIRRRDKIGFATPDKDWVASKTFIKFLKEIITSESFKSRKYWKQDVVLSILQDHENDKRDYSEDLWRLINTELWLRMFMDSKKEIPEHSFIKDFGVEKCVQSST